MLIAIIVGILLGGGTTGVMAYIADTRSEVKSVVVDPERRSEAGATLKQMKKRASAMNKQAGKSARQLKKALRDHDVTEERIEAIWAAHYDRVDQFNRDMIDLRFELKEHVTRDEWQQLFGQQ